METIKVHNHGHVRLDDCMADDLSVVNSARVSFANRSEVMNAADEGVLRFLMKNRHGTPFEHNAFRFNVRVPMFVAREWFRHRIGSFNEESLRYSRARLDFYLPDIEGGYVRSQVGKPGNYTFEPAPYELAVEVHNELIEHYEACGKLYDSLVDRGIAKEIARLVLPAGIYTEFFWTINARSLMNFVALRNDEHAQREIRDYATVVEQFFAETMPITYDAFLNNGRKAP